MYRDVNLSSEQRANELLKLMTIDEKIDQMLFMGEIHKYYSRLTNGEDVKLRGGISGELSKVDDEDCLDKVCKYIVENSRLGIPVLYGTECLHGVYHPKATVFPQSAGLGCSFNRENIYKMAEILGMEARAVGIRQVMAPDVDVARDPRWGRMQETYGEDTYLVGEYGAQYVKGVQKNKVATTVKHYIAYGFPECGINLSPAHVGEREIREVMLEPFKKCVDAGTMMVMPSYNEVDGEPVHASEKLLRTILRDELGFEGAVISDWGAVYMLDSYQKVADGALAAGKMALKAGVDIEAPGEYGYADEFRNAAKNGEIDINLIDEAVLRILKIKFELGLFENFGSDAELKKQMHSDKAIQLSREMDEESILLLKNDGILPLNENKIGKVAVIGNNAKDTFLGDYVRRTSSCVSFYDGMVNRLGEDRVLYSKGCNPITCTDEMIDDAVRTAMKADVVMLVLGDKATEGGGIGGKAAEKKEVTKGEGYDTHDLNLLPSQRRLFDEVIKLGKPTILIVYGGSPFTLEKDVEKVNGFMFSFGGGEQSGNAFANLIFGDKTPSAKLAISFPKSTGHIPCYYNHKVSARGSFYKRPGSETEPGRDYVLASPEAWLPFGFGLTYTTVEYSDLICEVLEDGRVAVSVCVENKGDYEINESVLLFVKAHRCPISPFIKRLREFSKVMLKPGDRKTVNFMLDDEDFSYIDHNMKTAKNYGKHTIMIDNLSCEIMI